MLPRDLQLQNKADLNAEVGICGYDSVVNVIK